MAKNYPLFQVLSTQVLKQSLLTGAPTVHQTLCLQQPEKSLCCFQISPQDLTAGKQTEKAFQLLEVSLCSPACY